MDYEEVGKAMWEVFREENYISEYRLFGRKSVEEVTRGIK